MTPLTCLALAIHFEARSEPLDGQAAVASVVLERVDMERYPDTICEVVFQRKQFSAFNNGIPAIRDQRAWETSRHVAQMALDDIRGVSPIQGATMYHADHITPYWVDHYEYLGQVGSHVFYGAND